jgi:two-component system, chemotaxis family, sensor kinase CheA
VAKDPYKYFRIEAREILEGLSQGALELEKGASHKDVVTRLFRYAHTLKGAARVVKQSALADGAHAIEEVLSPHRASGVPVPRGSIDELLRLVDTMTSTVAALGSVDAPPVPPDARPGAAAEVAPVPSTKSNDVPPTAPAAAVSAPVGDERLETVRVEIQEMDALLDDIFQASAQITALAGAEAALAQARQDALSLLDQVTGRRATRNVTSSLERARAIAEQLSAALAQVEGRLAQGRDQAEGAIRHVRERAHRLRLVPASTIFPTLERAVRDAARERGVSVSFVASGGENRLEGHVLLAVRDALLHAARNAVAHGIEPAEGRARLGKAAVGRVELSVERRGHQVVFLCRDDGGGIDVGAVRRVAVERRLVSATDAESLSAKDAMQLVFLPGVSTSTEVTELSGRGVGLDVVLETARRFKGDAEVHSEQGRQTSIEIRVPVSLSSVSSLLVDVGGVTHALPLDAAIGAVRVSNEEIVRAGDKQTILAGERAVPFSPLAHLLGLGEGNGIVRRACSAIVLRAGGRLAAIGVDRLLGTTELVMKPLPALAGSVPLVMGASLDADGNPQLVLDAGALVAAACAAYGSTTDRAGPQRPPILVIDDSLTTRMLEQSILESAGYEVDLATSAEEALEKARQRGYGLFVCDVEMPGMDGYGFVTATRADANLREVPVIMVTSLNAPENRQRGLDAGASEYIVKGEFDQGRLLHRIRALIG